MKKQSSKTGTVHKSNLVRSVFLDLPQKLYRDCVGLSESLKGVITRI